MNGREAIEDPTYILPAGTMQQPGLGLYISDRAAMRFRRSISNPVCALPEGVMQQPGLGYLGSHKRKGSKTAKNAAGAVASTVRKWARNRKGGPTDACSGLYHDARLAYPQLTLQQFYAYAPRCAGVLNCGDNRLSDGSVVTIGCTTNPVARPNNYVFLGDLNPSDLLGAVDSGSTFSVSSPLLIAGIAVLGVAILLSSGRKVSRKWKKSRQTSARRKARISALKNELRLARVS